ncbi:MAG: tocopherol cyclase family protein [Acholeplasmataceae bacterium]
MLKKIVYPEFFQGKLNKKAYFEGWYYKLVALDQSYSLALIPGVSLNPKDPHAFIQVFFMGHGKLPKLKTYYVRYGIDQFSTTDDTFSVTIGQSRFSKTAIDLDISIDDLSLSGHIDIKDITPIQRHLLMPNIMGFFGYFSFMECYHGVVSLTHQIAGDLIFNDLVLSFTGGKGYIEKDWGKSFPRAYVWIQTNHFKEPSASFMFSYADIPFLGFYFKGLISILYVNQKEYRFATYNFSKVKREIISENTVCYTLKKGRYRLEFCAQKDESVDLASPKNGLMNQTIKEGLSGEVFVKLWRRKTLIFDDHGTSAGIEIMKEKTTD